LHYFGRWSDPQAALDKWLNPLRRLETIELPVYNGGRTGRRFFYPAILYRHWG
jgi:hypothetical protein